MSRLTDNLGDIAKGIRHTFASRDAAREKVIPLCREVIRYSSSIIRAVHRQEFGLAADLLASARKLLGEIETVVVSYCELAYSGFVRDAQKEFAEASVVLALVKGDQIPGPEELGVDAAAYVNGIGEAVGELRRYLLDAMRQGNLSRGEELLSAMDDIYGVLVTMDFPDSITAGLRRTTDIVRGVLERTRSDLTLSIGQKMLLDRLCSPAVDGLGEDRA
jgi:translin